jgi:hypothetical protein
MSDSVEEQIDELYRLPLAEFTPARNALAKSLGGDVGKRVKALAKATLVPWAVNQVYWRARATYDRLLKSGERLRAAQIAALEGRTADVRDAADAHRRAINDAVSEAERLASPSRSQPNTDALSRTFEALSLAKAPTATPGRLIEPLQPAGFEALAGITPQPATERPVSPPRPTLVSSQSGSKRDDRKARIEQERALAAQQAAAEAARTRAAEIKKAEAALALAEKAEQQTRATWEAAHDELIETRRALANLKSTLKSEI